MLSLSLRRPFLGTVRPFLTRGLLNEPPSKAGMGEIDPDRKKGQPKEGEAFVAPKLQKKMLGSDKNLGGRPAGVDGDGGGDRTAGAGESSGMRKGGLLEQTIYHLSHLVNSIHSLVGPPGPVWRRAALETEASQGRDHAPHRAPQAQYR